MDLFPPELIIKLIKTKDHDAFEKSLEVIINTRSDLEVEMLRSNIKQKYFKSADHIRKLWACVHAPQI